MHVYKVRSASLDSIKRVDGKRREDPSLRDSFYDLSTSGRSSSSKGTHLFSKKNNNI
jgi:hypothetical protein